MHLHQKLENRVLSVAQGNGTSSKDLMLTLTLTVVYMVLVAGAAFIFAGLGLFAFIPATLVATVMIFYITPRLRNWFYRKDGNYFAVMANRPMQSYYSSRPNAAEQQQQQAAAYYGRSQPPQYNQQSYSPEVNPAQSQQQQGMKYCIFCGTPLRPEWKVCTTCGKPQG